MNSRERIFAALRESTAEAVPMTHTRPRLDENLAALFETNALAAAATLDHVSDIAALPNALTAYLASSGQTDAKIAYAPAITELFPDPKSIPTAQHSGVEIAVTGCVAAVAETGSVLLASSPEHPSTLNFLPETHVVVIHAGQLVAHLEDAWAAIDTMPRALNLVTGPSRTADIEQTLQLGAHGPRRLHLMLVNFR